MYMMTIDGRGVEPNEYDPQYPVPCSVVGCEVVMDEEDDDLEYADSEAYCKDHVQEARRKAFAAAIKAELPGKINEVMEWFSDIEKEYKLEDESAGNPYQALDDLRARIEHSYLVDGRDTGWRDGMMLDDDEAREIVWDYEKTVNQLSITIRVMLDLIDNPEYKRQVSPSDMFEWGTQLAHAANMLEKVKGWRDRTRRGVGLTY